MRRRPPEVPAPHLPGGRREGAIAAFFAAFGIVLRAPLAQPVIEPQGVVVGVRVPDEVVRAHEEDLRAARAVGEMRIGGQYAPPRALRTLAAAFRGEDVTEEERISAMAAVIIQEMGMFVAAPGQVGLSEVQLRAMADAAAEAEADSNAAARLASIDEAEQAIRSAAVLLGLEPGGSVRQQAETILTMLGVGEEAARAWDEALAGQTRRHAREAAAPPATAPPPPPPHASPQGDTPLPAALRAPPPASTQATPPRPARPSTTATATVPTPTPTPTAAPPPLPLPTPQPMPTAPPLPMPAGFPPAAGMFPHPFWTGHALTPEGALQLHAHQAALAQAAWFDQLQARAQEACRQRRR